MWRQLWENLIDPSGRNGRWTHAILTGVLIMAFWSSTRLPIPHRDPGSWAEPLSSVAGVVLLGVGYLGIVNAIRRLNHLGLTAYLAPLGMVPFVNFAYVAFVLFAPGAPRDRWHRRVRDCVEALQRDLKPQEGVSLTCPEDRPGVVRITYTSAALERCLDQEAALEAQHPFAKPDPLLWYLILVHPEDLRKRRDRAYLRRLASGWWWLLGEAATLEIADDRGTIRHETGQLPMFLR